MTDLPDNLVILVFPPFPQFPVTRKSTALIIVDMQKADAHPDYGIGVKARAAGRAHAFEFYWKAVRCAVENQQKLIAACRAAGVQIIYTRIATLTRDARDVGNQHRNVNVFVAKDSVEAEILPEIAPGEDDIVISKTSSSPFTTTAIHQLLHNLGVDTLLVCGVVTNGCVEGTVRDASDLGYNVIMIPDASAALSPELHQSAITNLDDAFCNCRETARVVEELNALRIEAHRKHH
jgi:ureidoacrylate peracid hydrolase